MLFGLLLGGLKTELPSTDVITGSKVSLLVATWTPCIVTFGSLWKVIPQKTTQVPLSGTLCALLKPRNGSMKVNFQVNLTTYSGLVSRPIIILTPVMMEIDNQAEMPPINKALLDALESSFPAQDFPATDSVPQLNFHYGQRSVVNFIKHHYQLQTENIINPE